MEGSSNQRWKLADTVDEEGLKHLYKCVTETCSFATADEKLFRIHIRRENHNKECCYCFKGFDNAKTLAMHMSQHHALSAFQCGLCFYRTSTYFFLSQHYINHHKGCEQCYSHFVFCENTSDVDLPTICFNEYKKTQCLETILELSCHKCGFGALDYKTFHRHSCLIEASDTSMVNRCSICKTGSNIFTADELVAHYEIHGVYQYQCLICGDHSNNSGTIISHCVNSHPEFGHCWIDRNLMLEQHLLDEKVNPDIDVLRTLYSLLKILHLNHNNKPAEGKEFTSLAVKTCPQQLNPLLQHAEHHYNGQGNSKSNTISRDDQPEEILSMFSVPRRKRFRKALDIATSLEKRFVNNIEPTNDNSQANHLNELITSDHRNCSTSTYTDTGAPVSEPSLRSELINTSNVPSSVRTANDSITDKLIEKNGSSPLETNPQQMNDAPTENENERETINIVTCKRSLQTHAQSGLHTNIDQPVSPRNLQAALNEFLHTDRDSYSGKLDHGPKSMEKLDSDPSHQSLESIISTLAFQSEKQHSVRHNNITLLKEKVLSSETSENIVGKQFINETTVKNIIGIENRVASTQSQDSLSLVVDKSIDDKSSSRSMRSLCSDTHSWHIGYGSLVMCFEKNIPCIQQLLELKLGEMLCIIEEKFPEILDAVSLSLLNGVREESDDESSNLPEDGYDEPFLAKKLMIETKNNLSDINGLQDQLIIVSDCDDSEENTSTTSLSTEQLFTCRTDRCPFQCRDICTFIEHLMIRHGDLTSFSCGICGEHTISFNDLKVHYDTTHSQHLVFSDSVTKDIIPSSTLNYDKKALDDELDKMNIPRDNIFKHSTMCSCKYETKVRSNLVSHIQKHIANAESYIIHYSKNKKEHNVAKKSSSSRIKNSNLCEIPFQTNSAHYQNDAKHLTDPATKINYIHSMTRDGTNVNNKLLKLSAISKCNDVANHSIETNDSSGYIHNHQAGSVQNGKQTRYIHSNTGCDIGINLDQQRSNVSSVFENVHSVNLPADLMHSANVNEMGLTKLANVLSNKISLYAYVPEKYLYRCGYESCTFLANDSRDLSVHLQMPHNNTSIICKHCQVTFKSFRFYHKHLCLHGPALYKCSMCGEFYAKTHSNVERHCISHHLGMHNWGKGNVIMIRDISSISQNYLNFLLREYEKSHSTVLEHIKNINSESTVDNARDTVNFTSSHKQNSQLNNVTIKTEQDITSHVTTSTNQPKKCSICSFAAFSRTKLQKHIALEKHYYYQCKICCYRDYKYREMIQHCSKYHDSHGTSLRKQIQAVQGTIAGDNIAVGLLHKKSEIYSNNKTLNVSLLKATTQTVQTSQKNSEVVILQEKEFDMVSEPRRNATIDIEQNREVADISRLGVISKASKNDEALHSKKNETFYGNEKVKNKDEEPNVNRRSKIPEKTKETSIFYEKLYYCQKCPAVFLNKLDLQSHLYMKYNYMPYKCARCNYTASTLKLLQNHTKKVHSSRISKVVKLKRDINLENEIQEITNHAGIVREVSRQKLGVDNVEYLVNSSQATVKYQCLHCGYGSNFAQNMQVHLSRKHTSWLPFQCAYCSMVSSIKSDFKRHIRKDHPGSFIKILTRDINSPSAIKKTDRNLHVNKVIWMDKQSENKGQSHFIPLEFLKTDVQPLNNMEKKHGKSPKVILKQLSPNSLLKHVHQSKNVPWSPKPLFKCKLQYKSAVDKNIVKSVLHYLKEDVSNSYNTTIKSKSVPLKPSNFYNTFDTCSLSLKVRAWLGNKIVDIPLNDIVDTCNFNSFVRIEPIMFHMSSIE